MAEFERFRILSARNTEVATNVQLLGLAEKLAPTVLVPLDP